MDWPSILALLGAAGTGCATVVVTWLRTRVGDVTVTVTSGPDGPAIDLNATNVRNLDAEGLRRQIADVVRGLADSQAPSGAQADVGERPGDRGDWSDGELETGRLPVTAPAPCPAGSS
ncbi:effector-associated constant component EACC1, partial [Frankia sp. CiP1_Cm_nod1]|uniref:effector-associated constant component EACC1 n=1 Tax=Frankia sp. CiP1_Cm_nod1 TaxID=2897160 RepID=UPI0040446B6C